MTLTTMKLTQTLNEDFGKYVAFLKERKQPNEKVPNRSTALADLLEAADKQLYPYQSKNEGKILMVPKLAQEAFEELLDKTDGEFLFTLTSYLRQQLHQLEKESN